MAWGYLYLAAVIDWASRRVLAWREAPQILNSNQGHAVHKPNKWSCFSGVGMLAMMMFGKCSLGA